MPKYIMTILARKKNALGVHSRFTAEREAVDKEAARLALYDEFEHISILECHMVDVGTQSK